MSGARRQRRNRRRLGLALNTKPAQRAAADPAEPALSAQDRLDMISQGAYVLAEPTEVGLKKKAQAVIIATGSEVQLALHAQAALAKRYRGARGVHAQHHRLRPPERGLQIERAAAQAAARGGRGGRHRRLVEIRLRRGGGPRQLRRKCTGPALFKHFHFTAQNVAAMVRKVLAA